MKNEGSGCDKLKWEEKDWNNFTNRIADLTVLAVANARLVDYNSKYLVRQQLINEMGELRSNLISHMGD